jgi:S1-C subfamily serine protease
MGGTVKNLTAEKTKLGLDQISGVLVLEAPSGSALEKAHLVKGDVILTWDKSDVPDFTTLEKLAKITPSPTLITAWHDFAKLMLWR